VRRKALDEAASALEPEAASAPAAPPTAEPSAHELPREAGTSPVTSQHARARSKVLEFPPIRPERTHVRLAPRAGLEPATLRLTASRGYGILLVLQWFSRILVPANTWCSGANCSLIVHSRKTRDVLGPVARMAHGSNHLRDWLIDSGYRAPCTPRPVHSSPERFGPNPHREARGNSDGRVCGRKRLQRA
jgi:hypothetical protein